MRSEPQMKEVKQRLYGLGAIAHDAIISRLLLSLSNYLPICKICSDTSFSKLLNLFTILLHSIFLHTGTAENRLKQDILKSDNNLTTQGRKCNF